MGQRLRLHELLKEVPEVREVYFQPPASLRMEYPCIRYTKSRPRVNRADNKLYKFVQCYELIVIDTDPDSGIARYIVENFSMAEMNTTYISDNLYHTSITLYY